RRFLRPFLAVGLLGGDTTYSAYAGGVMRLLTGHAPALAVAYALTSIVAAPAARWCGMRAARARATRAAWGSAWAAQTRRSGGRRECSPERQLVIFLAVLAGGMIGAPARYLADRLVQARHDNVIPWGTFTVNMAGSVLLGFLLGAERHLGLPPVMFALLGTG